jgi:hypothetical protein
MSPRIIIHQATLLVLLALIVMIATGPGGTWRKIGELWLLAFFWAGMLLSFYPVPKEDWKGKGGK